MYLCLQNHSDKNIVDNESRKFPKEGKEDNEEFISTSIRLKMFHKKIKRLEIMIFDQVLS